MTVGRLIRIVLSGALIAAGERVRPKPNRTVATRPGDRVLGHYMRGAGQC